MARLKRETKETQIQLEVLPGGDTIDIETDDDFLSHMIVTFARYSGLSITLRATGDLRHHLVEDVAITLGLAIKEEIAAQAERFGSATIPMDDALVRASIDVGGRAWYEGPLPSPLYQHFLQAMAVNMAATLHVIVDRGTDKHHVVEAAIKATGMALRQAMRIGDTVFSTKGAVAVEWGEIDESFDD